MSGIMRAPSRGVNFSIPYSGTHKFGDCILVSSVSSMEGITRVNAYYTGDEWICEDSVIYFSDENNVISFTTMSVLDGGYAALIPGPNYA